jgi:hypothetical protein
MRAIIKAALQKQKTISIQEIVKKFYNGRRLLARRAKLFFGRKNTVEFKSRLAKEESNSSSM